MRKRSGILSKHFGKTRKRSGILFIEIDFICCFDEVTSDGDRFSSKLPSIVTLHFSKSFVGLLG
ncbi:MULTISPECIES: hypothetical protein [Chlorogloeopsis]|uniref:hypothetical protein n=1 Tax=Chlorogloeopsis TaxID=1123 RepID=UPI0002D282EA|nr:hypothetical protein [Chlorogloeopsis fritschii]